MEVLKHFKKGKK